MTQTIFIASPLGEELSGIIKLLERSDYKIVEAHNGEEASKGLRSKKITGAIILNSELENPSALDICAEIKTNKNLTDIPVFLLTGKKTNRNLYKNAGILEFLERPYSPYGITKRLASFQFANKKDHIVAAKSGKKQLVGVGIFLLLFLVFLGYFIIMPMMRGELG